MPFIELEIEPPLRDCLCHCEVVCVADCCGIDAFSTDPALIAEWAQEAGMEAARQASMQADQLVAVVGHPDYVVSSVFLNHHTSNGNGKFLSFLETIRAALRERSF